MKTKSEILLFLITLLVAFSPVYGKESSWLTRAEISVSATGTVETYLPADLHKVFPNGPEKGNFDLSLAGPDQNRRAFELYWRETSEAAQMRLDADHTEWLDDGSLLWEARLPENYLVSSILVNLPGMQNAAKASFLGQSGPNWETLGENVALLKPSANSSFATANIQIDEKLFSRVRIKLTGLNKEFKKTPVQTLKVFCEGRRLGENYLYRVETLEFEEVTRDEDSEVRVNMPGTGIYVESVEIHTEAMFQGKWCLGSEKVVLGQEQFQAQKDGEIIGVSPSPMQFNVPVMQAWNDRTLIVTLKSDSYFGKIQKVVAKLRLPRITFAAEVPGSYFLLAGTGQNKTVAENPMSSDRSFVSKLSFKPAELNKAAQAENILENLVVPGGPFSARNYGWKATVSVPAPGFYQLRLSPQVALENQLSGLRVVHDNQQVPFFSGRYLEREIPLSLNQDLNSADNQTILSLRLPSGQNQPRYLKVKTFGIFDRTVFFQKHESGKVGWQTWKTVRWQNSENRPTEIHLSLSGFPSDQKDLRLVINNGSNQSIKIDGISAWYRTSDLYFIGAKAGEYLLYGGNQTAKSPKYDLELIQNRLLEMIPQVIDHEQPVEISQDEPDAPQVQDKGGPFDSAGYTWVANFNVPSAGLTQLSLNQKVSLEDLRHVIRIVKNGNQVPYFPGEAYLKKVSLNPVESYDRNSNQTSVEIRLPTASKHWKSLEFNVPGVFIRKPVVRLHKPGNLGWKKWKELNWVGTDNKENRFVLDLESLPRGETELMLEVAHGDNSPVVIAQAEAVFQTNDLFFNASEAGDYQVFGGNSSAKAPAYDIAMIKNSMLKTEPQKVHMGDASTHSETAIKKQIEEVFSEKGYGLYFILGLVTIILLAIIVKMFPDVSEEGKEKGSEDK